jgi:opacity protein-like surface antigen
MKKLSLAVLGLMIMSSISFAQLTKGSVGLSPGASFGPTGSTTMIDIAYAFAENIRLDAGFGLSVNTSKAVDETKFAINTAASRYMWKVDEINTFIGAGIGFSKIKAGSEFGFQTFLGTEWNFNPRFAWAGKVGLGFQTIAGGGILLGTIAGWTGFTWWFK